MKVILHFGMPKAGSSALQAGLVAARPALVEAGILYPRAPVLSHSANALTLGLLPRDELPRYVRHALKGKPPPEALFADWMVKIRSRMAQIGGHTLVLSAENLWEIRSPGPAARLRAVLQDLGATRIEAVAYLRRPSDWYLSAAQQVLRASHKLRPLRPVAYRAPLETFAAHVADPGALRVFLYDRGAFPGGDVLNHFRETVLPGAPLEAAPAGRAVNETLSAEGMALLQDYRAAIHPGANSRFTDDTRHLRAALKEAEDAVGGETRPRLYPEIADRLDHGSTDLAWLAEAYGLRFAGIDHARIAPADWSDAPSRVAQICPVDAARRQRLSLVALRVLALQAAELEAARKKKQKKRPAPKAGPAA